MNRPSNRALSDATAQIHLEIERLTTLLQAGGDDEIQLQNSFGELVGF